MWLKLIGGSVAGVFTAGLAIYAVEKIGHGKFEGDALFALVLVGYGIGALLGGALASLIGGNVPAYIVAGILIMLSAVNLFAFPHPWWFMPTAIAVIVAGGWIGTKIPNAL